MGQFPNDYEEVTGEELTGTEKILIDANGTKFIQADELAEYIGPGGGGASAMGDLTDVTITAPAADQVLKYDGSGWVNGDAPGGTPTLEELTDVNLTTPDTDDELVFDGSEWKNRARGFANFLDHGGVNDGVTDNYAALVALAATGVNIYIPEGTYIVTPTTTNGVTLQAGQKIFGAGKKTILKTAYNGVILFMNNDSWVDGIKFEGSGKAATAALQTGVFSYQMKNGIVSNCWFEGFAGDGSNTRYGGGVAVADVNFSAPMYNGLRIINCVFYNNKLGAYLARTGEYSHVTGCTFTDNTVGLRITAGNYSVVGCHVSANTTGIVIANDVNSGHATITGCTINHNTTCFTITGLTQGHTFTGCMFYYGNYAITNCVGVKFVGCDFYGGGTMTLTNNTNLVMMGCRWPESPTSNYIVKSVVSGEDFNAAADAFGNCDY